ncbi:hypothetical protein ACFX1R_048514 [Malus domestica]
MSSSSHKNDNGVPPLYCQGGSLSKVAYFKISSDDLFRDFLKAYRHAILSGIRVKHAKDGHIERVGQLRSRHMLFDNSSKGDHDWTNETLEISGEWESDSFPELRVPTVFISDSKFGFTPKTSLDMKKVHVALDIPSEYREWR